MNLVQKRIPIPTKSTAGSKAHWIDYIRIILGAIILAKGISFYQ
jgi:hypothetical protein